MNYSLAILRCLIELIRTAFVPKGHRFIVADFSAIEARVISWLAGEKWRLEFLLPMGRSRSRCFHDVHTHRRGRPRSP